MWTHSLLVTGAGSGIGLAITREALRQGARVFACSRTESLSVSHEHCSIVPLDVTDQASIESAHHLLLRALDGKPLDAIVNGAGIVTPSPFSFGHLESWINQIDTNLIGTARITATFAPLMRAGGTVVNIGSISGRVSLPTLSGYAASKAGLRAFTQSLRLEYRSAGIRVTYLELGNVRTPIWEKALAHADAVVDDAATRERVRRFIEIAVRTSMPPERVAIFVMKLLQARRVRARYVLGVDARLWSMAETMLPARLLEFVITKLSGFGNERDEMSEVRERDV